MSNPSTNQSAQQASVTRQEPQKRKPDMDQECLGAVDMALL